MRRDGRQPSRRIVNPPSKKGAPPQTEAPRLKHKAPRWFKEWCDSISEFVTASQPIAGFGTSISQLPKGRQIHSAGGITAQGVATGVNFQGYDASTGGVAKIRVKSGVVTVFGGAAYIPTGMYIADTTPYIVNAVGTSGFVYLVMEVDGDGLFQSLTIGIGATVPVDTATIGIKVLVEYGTDSGQFFVTGAIGDQNYLHCGGYHAFWS